MATSTAMVSSGRARRPSSKRARTSRRVEALVGNVTTRLSDLDLHTFDLIWDCTANRIVRAHLERARRTDTTPWPHC
ncbi:hypothetical protein OG345_40040 [Streptomyces sp. NBC_01220]|uniref:hypothetical protein n=1 Tax=Streptomyces sp. NBC_01220 TaxID=2903781 RepID=UPI00352CE12F|nr:hypothetical protein OG345_40040 [Streptomyces sp. NBC_01220]